MRKKLALIFIFLFCFAYADEFTYPTRILYLPQGHVHQDLTGKGFLGSTQSSISNINAGNPACITDLKGLNIGSSFQFETRIKEAWLTRIIHYRNNFLPQSIGMSYDYKNLYFAIASNQMYNTRLDYGKIQGTMVWDNEQGYIDTEVFNPYRDETIFKNSAICAVKLENLIFKNSILSMGFQFNANYYSFFQTMGKSMIPVENGEIKVKKNEVEENDIENNFSIGLRYSINNNKLLNIKLGLFYESEIIYDKIKHIDGEVFRYQGNIPQKLHSGFSISFPKQVSFTGNITYYFWESLEQNFNIKNLLEYSSSISYQLNHRFQLSLGSKITDHKFLVERSYGYSDYMKLFAKYFTAGCVYYYKNYEFDFVIADSHLFSDEWRKHTIFKFGLGYSFNK